jgi:outer membrane lipoprotein LolB
MHLTRLSLVFACVALMQGCVSMPATQSVDQRQAQSLYQQHLQDNAGIETFSLQARIGVQTQGKGFSGSLHWQHHANQDEIALFSPLGGQVARILKNADGVTLTDANGRIQTAIDVESLTQNLLGWRLPLQGLADWSLGRPHSTPIQALNLDERGLIKSLQQDGWLISYEHYSAQYGHLLPSKMVLRSEELTLKILIEEWRIPND